MGGDQSDSRPYRRALVQALQRDGHLRSPGVAAAILAVPRELFVPGLPLEAVYRPSEAIVTKRIEGVSVSSASAPDVIALMLEQLDARPGDRVLEIGAGTGYNAALLAEVVGDKGRVVTLDIDDDLVRGARDHLRAAGYEQVSVVQADGALGYPAAQPYDRIMLTVASSDIAPAWREQLTHPGGRLVMPLSLAGVQRCVAFVAEEVCLASASVRSCSFVALRGLLAAGSLRVALDPAGSLLLSGGEEQLPMPVDAIRDRLGWRMRLRSTGVTTSIEQLHVGLHLWLVTRLPFVCTLWGVGRIPELFALPERGGHGTLCVLDPASESLALLAWAERTDAGGTLGVLAHESGEALADRVEQVIRDWEQAGRPTDSRVHIRACPHADGAPPPPDEVVVAQRYTRFSIRWTQPPASFTV